MDAKAPTMIGNQTSNNAESALLAKAEGAFLGSAIGDALGWPNEDRSKWVGPRSSRKGRSPDPGFREWVRRAGGRFYSHEEVVAAGEYSDDTQLLLCTARSLLVRSDWWHHFTKQELTAWTFYERGGGRATKAAATAWAEGRTPWSSRKTAGEVESYFQAGGNGAAMRIMPHALRGASEVGFRDTARDIAANSICTHGHPRALVGALVYGYSLWLVFRKKDTLRYGELIEELLDTADTWSSLPDVSKYAADWHATSNVFTHGGYSEAWNKTIREMASLLQDCRSAMSQGALSVDRDLLARLGCFDRKVNGAGTVCAAASVFLASRYAVDPIHGIIEAAFAEGADTDTLAAMTGGLLGAVSGPDSLGDYARHVQDAHYLRRIAQSLADGGAANRPTPSEHAQLSTSREAFSSRLRDLGPNDTVPLPDGRTARLAARMPLKARSGKIAVEWLKLIANDGQSIFVKKIERVPSAARSEPSGLFESPPPEALAETFQPVEAARVGVILSVTNMEKTKTFYQRALGLRVSQETDRAVNFGGVLTLVATSPEHHKPGEAKKPSYRKAPRVQIETRPLQRAFQNVVRSGAEILTPISSARKTLFFRCIDPEGNIVEVRESLAADLGS